MNQVQKRYAKMIQRYKDTADDYDLQDAIAQETTALEMFRQTLVNAANNPAMTSLPTYDQSVALVTQICEDIASWIAEAKLLIGLD